MWIRKLSSPANLNLYRHSTSVPKAFEPIFGTAGVTNARYWNGMMFHPTVAAPPGTNSYAATFEVYLLGTTTGQEVPNSSSGPLVFNWTNVPDGRPAVSSLGFIDGARSFIVRLGKLACNFSASRGSVVLESDT